MKKIMDAIIGNPEKAGPARKYTAYALLGTVAVLALALVVFAASSIAFAVVDAKQAELPETNESDDGEVISSKAVTYGVISADELKTKTEYESVNVKEKRSQLTLSGVAQPIYYAVSGSGLKLYAPAQESVNKKLVDFYEANKSNKALVVDGSEAGKNCTMPMITNASGMTFDLKVCKDNSSLSQSNTYRWIYANAYKYGFAYNGDSFRYVGEQVAYYINARKLAGYDAFITALKSNTANVSITVSKVTYEMYYLAADAELKVPTNYAYEVVADGDDGYVIVINKSKRIEAPSTAG